MVKMSSLILAIYGYLIVSVYFPVAKTVRIQRSETEKSAERLRELVRRLRDYIDSVSKELESYEEQLTQEATPSEGGGPKDPHGMVVVPDEEEKTTTPASASSTENSESDPCHCDCQRNKRPEEDDQSMTTAQAVDSDNVEQILKTIRELLHEAEGE